MHFDGHTGETAWPPSQCSGRPSALDTDRRADGMDSALAGPSPQAKATCCTNSTVNRRWRCTKQYLGDRGDELPSAALLFPLTVWSENASSGLVRTVLSVDEQTQSMTFAGDVPQGWSARLMWTSLERSPKAPPKRLRRVTTTPRSWPWPCPAGPGDW